MAIIEHGFYILDEQFFVDFPDEYLKGNKTENRPHYYCLTDPKTGLAWMIPLSNQIEKYERLIDERLSHGRPCDILHSMLMWQTSQ